jgi:3-deoxy-D-manno-octulosonic-acid transferase
MSLIIDCIYLLAAAVISPMVAYRMARHKRYRSGWAQRFGRITRRYPAKKCVWLHAVSVGEVNATRTIVEELKKRLADFEIVISTTTDTGFSRATELFGKNHAVFYFPLDFSPVMQRAFRNIRPAICLLVELEVWPNFVQIAHQSNIPVVVINGRISDRSFSRYKKIRPVVKNIFKKVDLVLAQTDQYAQRFKDVGCPMDKVIVTGSLKYDTAQVTDKVEGAAELANQLKLDKGEKLWVAGGTGPDEEKIIIDTYLKLKQQGRFDNLRLAVIPRKPERFDEVAQLIEQSGFDIIRYSQIKNHSTEKSNTEPRATSDESRIILGDTMGDLRKFYSLADIIFVGRSLVPMGGSDMMEAAALGKCTIFGPYAFNFQQAVDDLLANQGAIMVRDEQDLLRTMQKCLLEPDFAATIARNGRETIRKNQGATKKTIGQITNILNIV